MMLLCESPPTTQRRLRLGNLTLGSRYILAPLAGYTTLGFRLCVRECGGLALATTDLINARALLERSRKTFELIATCPADRPLAVQLYGGDPGLMAAAAQWLADFGATVIDINMGCPVRKVVKGGGGSALLCSSPEQTIGLVRAVVDAVKIPVTVKMRLGWDAASHTAPFFAREFEQVGCAGITIHGRTREQGFSGEVDHNGIRAVVEAVERIPIIGNGDIRTIADAERMFAETGCHGIAIGRGALLNPWFFQQLVEWETMGEVRTHPGYLERLEFMATHFQRLVEDRGEWYACLCFRKVANWYCKVLKPGRDMQQRLTMIGSPAEFSAMVQTLRDRYQQHGPPPNWTPHAEISVPKGPVERW